MAWRELDYGDRHWNVSLAAERCATSGWCLVLSFRAKGEPRTLWAPFPLESQSQAALFAQADRIPDTALTALLAERLG